MAGLLLGLEGLRACRDRRGDNPILPACHNQQTGIPTHAGKRQRHGFYDCGRVQARPAGTVRAQAANAQAVGLDEVQKSYSVLQNGSDVRGFAIGGVEGEDLNLTPESAYFMGQAFTDMLEQQLGKHSHQLRISIGRDPRLSGPLLQGAMAAGILSRGSHVADFGLATTPAMFMSCIMPGHEYDGGIIITASHLPYNRNGFKFCTATSGFDKSQISDLLKRAAKAHAEQGGPGVNGQVKYTDASYVLQAALATDGSHLEKVDFMPVYQQHLRNIIVEGIDHPEHREQPLKGFHIVLDAGNGGGGFLATQVLEPLGANIQGSQFLEPDGWFPNHSPNPENKEAMAACTDAVNRSKTSADLQADLGIVVDTDVDRSAVVGSNGEAVAGNRYIALMASIVLRKYPGTTIVTDSVTSNGLHSYIQERGGKHLRYRRGYKNIISKGVELNQQGTSCELMMETSGHGAMKENHFLDDGTYSASQILVEMVRRRLDGHGDLTEELLSELKEPAEAHEFRLKLKGSNYKEEGQQVLQRFHDWLQSGPPENWKMEAENHEGWRVAIDEGDGQWGWALLRASLHDPLLVLNVESETAGSCETVNTLCGFFEDHAKGVEIDLETLYDASTCEVTFE